VRLKVDVIVTGQSTVRALKQATSVIPIVLALATDPIDTGTVASLARPGGNVTGLSLQAPDLVGNRLELLREVVPNLRRVAILANIGYPAAALEMDDFLAARLDRLASMLLGWKFGAPRTSPLPSGLTRIARMRFTLLPTRS
jgi:putative ABC transport system substrate-binding protein